jgi:TetR/AcrR family transcriptional regulator, tetracycline repressor protein
MPLQRRTVVDAALQLLDELGLDALTTRAVTNRLGVQPGALYWHVRNKRALLTAVAERIMDEAFETPEPSGDWAEQVSGFAHAMRAALLRHRDGARLVATHTPVGPSALRAAEAGLAVMRSAGVPLDLAARFGDTVTSYVTGFVLQEQAAAPEPGASEHPGPLDPETLPNLSAWAAQSPPDRDAAFDTGIALITGGLRAALSTSTGRV